MFLWSKASFGHCFTEKKLRRGWGRGGGRGGGGKGGFLQRGLYKKKKKKPSVIQSFLVLSRYVKIPLFTSVC